MKTLYPKEDEVAHLINQISLRKNLTSYGIALKTEELVKKVISEGKWETAEELIQLLISYMNKFSISLPQESISCNVIRHILKLVRELYATEFRTQGEKQQSLHQIIKTGTTGNIDDYKRPLPSLRTLLLDNLAEYECELETSKENIAAQASDHIYANEIILTVGKSSTIESFLKSAAKTKKFEVLVVQNDPPSEAQQMVKKLADACITTTLVAETSIFRIMHRVNKVIIGAHTVMANGIVKATNSCHMAALAANHFSVPVRVITHLYKFSPQYLHSLNQEELYYLASPMRSMPSPHSVGNNTLMEITMFDYIPADLITLIISHHGGNTPSNVYQVFSELYHHLDIKPQNN